MKKIDPEAERERRIRDEMQRCIHFTGIQNESCRAGVNYRAHVGGDYVGWACRIPCVSTRYSDPEAQGTILSSSSMSSSRQTITETPSGRGVPVARCASTAAETDGQRPSSHIPIVEQRSPLGLGLGGLGLLACGQQLERRAR